MAEYLSSLCVCQWVLSSDDDLNECVCVCVCVLFVQVPLVVFIFLSPSLSPLLCSLTFFLLVPSFILIFSFSSFSALSLSFSHCLPPSLLPPSPDPLFHSIPSLSTSSSTHTHSSSLNHTSFTNTFSMDTDKVSAAMGNYMLQGWVSRPYKANLYITRKRYMVLATSWATLDSRRQLTSSPSLLSH